ncbi:MAG: SecY-interacting protein [Shewanellaceae bacterium]|nr:SecY-interacting protein [Shewanellaceae bacterium]
MSQISKALAQFTQRYVALHAQHQQPLSYFCGRAEQQSPCIIGEVEHGCAQWQAVPRAVANNVDFESLSQALELALPIDYEDFFRFQYAPPMAFRSDFGQGELLQCWDDEDFHMLKENLIGHVFMKRQLNLPPTFFIGVMDDETRVLSMKPHQPELYLEILGQSDLIQVALSLHEFLEQLEPRLTSSQTVELNTAPQSSTELSWWDNMKIWLYNKTR